MKWRSGLVLLLVLVCGVIVAGCKEVDPVSQVSPAEEMEIEGVELSERVEPSKPVTRTYTEEVTLGVLTPDLILERDKVVLDFALENLNSEIVQLSDYRGKLVLLNFWTTW